MIHPGLSQDYSDCWVEHRLKGARRTQGHHFVVALLQVAGTKTMAVVVVRSGHILDTL